MPTTIDSLIIMALIVLPGAIITLCYERRVAPVPSRLKRDFGERVIVFVIASAFISPMVIATTFALWRGYLHVPVNTAPSNTYRNVLVDSSEYDWWWPFAVWLYCGVPALIGLAAGELQKRWRVRGGSHGYRRRVAPQLRGWDWLFLDEGPKQVVAHLKGGGTIAGLFGPDSFASSIGTSHEEMFLEARIELDANGRIVLDSLGFPSLLDGAILLKGEDLQAIEVYPG